jgi:O-antigen/teichoic acid export membrane protein
MWLSRKEIEPIFRLLGLEDFSLGSLYDKQAIALSINFLISNLLQRVDLIISGFFFSSIFVGSYSMALVVFSTLSVFIAPQNRILAPTLSAHWKLGELGPMAKLLNEQIRHISCIIVPASIAISLSIPLLYKLLSGDYQIQWQVLLLLSLNFSIQGCLNFTGFALSMTGGEGIERRVLLFGVVFVCVLGACGAYLFGPVGMAFGILMGNIAGAVWRTLEASKRVESNLGWEFPFKLNIILSPIGCIGAYLVFFGKPNINLLLLIPVLYLVTSYTFIWYFVLSADERVSVSRRIPF